jgi:hypothetical protein
MSQSTDNKHVGRPKRLDLNSLLDWEIAWVALFCSLRDGNPETLVERSGSSGIFVKAAHDQDKVYVDIGGETKEVGGRETLTASIPGEKPVSLRQPKIIGSADEMKDWQEKAQAFEDKLNRVTMGMEPRKYLSPAVPHEKHIWEALLRARTAAQVRRAYSRSKIWLITRIEYPGGGFQEWSWAPLPRGLYRDAAAFCRAKLDPRYPARDKRKSGDYRRIEFLARVMAGLSLPKPIRPSYSIEIFRRVKHLEECQCWRCIREIAPRHKRSLANYLGEFGFR